MWQPIESATEGECLIFYPARGIGAATILKGGAIAGGWQQTRPNTDLDEYGPPSLWMPMADLKSGAEALTPAR